MEYTEGYEGLRRPQGREASTAAEGSGVIDAPRVPVDAYKNIDTKTEDFAAPSKGDGTGTKKALHIDSTPEAPAPAPAAATDRMNGIDTAGGVGPAGASVETGVYANADGAHTAPGFDGVRTAGLRQQDINVPAQQHTQQQQQQQQREHQPAVAARGSMVPDKEDGDDEPDGAAPRHTLQNYASRESGAAMLESSPGAKGMANLLVDSKDKYAISPCEDKQWAVLGLSEDIVVRTIKISSHEKYSSLVKDFQVLASKTYPVKEWLDLGVFTAKFVQGEQTFELPHPAHARYLKFKFLSHYADEFYCTVSQIKVHGSTMLEDFQYEFDQSSAEVREVTDYMMKKDHKPATNGNAVPSHGAAAGAATSAPRVTTTPGGAPQSQAESSQSATPSNEGGVEHRPHAATVATVPPGGKRPGGGSVGIGGSAGAGTVAVEEIVRGVPVEMVVPASMACLGPFGTDGVCRGEVLADGSSAGNAAEEASASLGAKIPAMGGTAAPGRPIRAEGETGVVNGGSDLEGGASSVGGPIGVGAAAGGAGLGGLDGDGAAGSAGAVREPGAVHAVGQDAAGHPPGERVVGGATSDSANGVAGSGAEGGIVVDKGGGPTGDDEPPPRKGIIHSTMEAISKAVHRGDGSKPKGGGGAKHEGVIVNDADAGGAASSSAVQEDASIGEGVGGDVSVAVAPTSGVDDVVKNVAVEGTNLPESGSMAATQQNTAGVRTNGVPAGGKQGDGDGGASSGVGLSEGQWTMSGNADPGAVEAETVARMGELTDADSAVGSAAFSETQPGDTLGRIQAGAEGSVLSNTAAAADFVASQATMRDGDGLTASSAAGPPSAAHGDPAGGKGNVAGSAFSESNVGSDELAKSSASMAGGGGGHVPQATVGAQTDASLRGELPPTGGHTGTTGGVPAEPIVRLDEVNAAALVAACLDRLSFTEFREEVLARTQHAQQSAGGGVAIGGQYESIFKTLMNKIKTLEINQSLFSLYIDDVHGCYQDVITQMLSEQERARVSRSELLSAQASHLMRAGDQWPAFQELQAKVAEVENRMLLSSMAWFTSLFCLLAMMCSCCFKVCRRCTYGNGPSGRERRGTGPDQRYYRGRRRAGDWSYECDDGPALDPPTYANGDGRRLEWRAEGAEEDRGYAMTGSARHAGDDIFPREGRSGCPAERVRGNNATSRLTNLSGKDHSVSRFYSANGDVDNALLDRQQQQKWSGEGRLGGGGVGMGGRVGARA